jgi:MoxR-like ATPase
MDLFEIRRFVQTVLDTVGKEMFGLDEVARFCLAALYSGGHVLLEGNPGVGKTELVKTMGRVLGLKWGRIQFTPDLMPADITGTLMPEADGTLKFQEGPVFASLLLADEINRATPKTQAAMLEAMAEKGVTVLGVRRPLPAPFMVMATQNPIDQEGTYNLPEAQSDRFMFKISVPPPDNPATILDIMSKRAGARANPPAERRPEAESPELPASPESAAELSGAIGGVIRSTLPVAALETHIANLYMATNRKFERLENTLGRKEQIKEIAMQFQFGLSPRAAGDIMLAAKAWVCLFPAEINCASAPHLASVVQAALRHRLKLSLDWEPANDGKTPADSKPQDVVDRLIWQLSVLTAPKYSGYHTFWERQWNG